MIILFGSYAKGTYVEHRYTANDGTTYEYISDYDFLVVTEKNTIKEYELEDIVNSRTKRTRPDINIQLHEIDYVNEGLEFGQYFFSDIISEGILLYDTREVQFAKPKELSIYELQLIAKRYFEFWFTHGTGFLKGVNFYINEGQLNIAVFTLHQATESFYYAILLVFTGYKPKTHNLSKLRKLSKSLSEDLFHVFPIEANKVEKYLFDLLKKGYIEARYKNDYSITLEELERLYGKVKQMGEIIEKVSSIKINSYS